MRMPVRRGRLANPASRTSGKSVLLQSGELRTDKSPISEFGVTGNESDEAERGKKGGRVGKVNGIEGDGVSTEKVGDVGETPGVLRRTKLDIGVFAERSEVEPKIFTVSLLSTRRRRRGDEGGRGDEE